MGKVFTMKNGEIKTVVIVQNIDGTIAHVFTTTGIEVWENNHPNGYEKARPFTPEDGKRYQDAAVFALFTCSLLYKVKLCREETKGKVPQLYLIHDELIYFFIERKDVVIKNLRHQIVMLTTQIADQTTE